MAPCRPSVRMARRNSAAALSGACIGKVAMPEKRSGFSLTSRAISSFWITDAATPTDASWS